MNKKLEKSINDQIQKELYSAYLYLSMAAYLDAMNFPGMSHWMKMQESEERAHAFKFYEFLNDRGSRVILQAIEQPPAEFASVKDVFEQVYAHEQKVTASINKLYALAKEVNDTAAEVFLQWFITEQVEEEKNDMEILAKLDMIKENTPALLMLDHELAGRK